MPEQTTSPTVRRIALVMVLVWLVSSAPPVMASHGALASEHTTDDDFAAGTITGGMEITGTGDAADVSLTPLIRFNESWEDGDTAEYTTDGDADGTEYQFEAQSSGTYHPGDYTVFHHLTADNGRAAYTESNSTDVNLDGSDPAIVSVPFRVEDFSDGNPDYQAAAELRLKVSTVDGNTATLRYRVATVDAAPSDDPSNLLFVADGHNSQSYTKLKRDINDDLAAAGYSNATGLNEVMWWIKTPGTASGVDEIGVRYDDLRVQSQTVGGYVSAAHTVEGVSAGKTNLSIDDATADVAWEGYNGSAWVTVSNATYTNGGVKTQDVGGPGYDKWRVRVQGEVSNGTGYVELHNEGVTADTAPPSPDNATASPSAGEQLSGTPFTAEINVSDPDFGTHGDNLTVEWYVDGSKQTTTYTDGNGTVSARLDAEGGDSTWHVEVTDEYGYTQASDTFVFEAPGELKIRNASAPEQAVTDAEVTVTFVASDTVIERTASDGNVSLDGLPLNETLVVKADAPGYSSRTAIIDDVFKQNEVYLLSDKVDQVDSRFTLTDATGNFPQDETTFFIERPLNISGETSFRIVSAGPFEVNGFTVPLEQDVRYRIKVRKAEGDVRTLGSYTPVQSETVELEIQGSGIDLSGEEGYDWSAYYENASSGERIVFEFKDTEDKTENLEVSICEQGAEVGNDSACFENFSAGGPIGDVKFTQPLTENESNKTWVVRWQGDRNGTISGERVVGDPTGDLVPELGDDVKLGLSILTVSMTMLLFTRINYVTGSITTSMVGGGLWMMGWLPPTAGGAVAVTLLVGVGYKIAGGR